MKKAFYIKTLGCKVNQYETQAMCEALSVAGYILVIRPADAAFIIINSCTVTHQSDRKTFYYARRLKKENQDACIVVAGCSVENKDPHEFYAKGIDIVIPNAAKQQIVGVLEEFRRGNAEQTDRQISAESAFSITRFAGHSRAFVKIQDGCNMNCSYCKVRIVRGKSRSRARDDIIDELYALVANGYKEVVFAGVQLGAFGKDLSAPVDLVELLRQARAIDGIERIRLSSLEPFDVSERLIRLIAEGGKFCPHFHLPLQSGADAILKRMRRIYSAQQYCDLIGRMRGAIPSFSLTTDVIVGFPGEDEAAFAATIELLRRSRPFKIHIFPFSARAGTDASTYSELVCSSVIKQRERILQTLDEELFVSTSEPLIGMRHTVLVEEYDHVRKQAIGRLGDYRQIRFPADILRPNDTVSVIAHGIKKGYLVGAPV